ncbi:GAF domain-containing protein [Actinoplanes palleronii]|uniref:GAF domain-containing protein n=1 Tax=Actinoplanes palleronii TaxID=113570 RepID=A0ABQ4BP80_9ACTN|nr:GAF domain-containing protein [Actinoplanes palleronii]GIE72469.1 hypothetical protein Apa02nite_085770 [Actinoplanes palleronii]
MNTMTDTELFTRLGDPARIHRLAEYDLHHPALRTHLDGIARDSAERLRAPVSLVSVLLDSAQFIIGRHGLSGATAGLQGVPAEWALCTQTVLTSAPYCVSDGTTNPRHSGNPMLTLTGLRSYAGVPLIDDNGQVLGAHCVLDTVPRHFTEHDIASLTEGAAEALRVLGRYHDA